MKNINNAVSWILAAAFLGLFLFVLATSKPWQEVEIRQSYSSGECVVMITYSSEFPNGKPEPCPTVLPERYTHVWVQ